MKENIGIVFGTFAPLHLGHLSIINNALNENKKVFVIVSGYKNDRGELYSSNLNLDNRYKLIKEEFKNNNNIIVLKINEDNIPKIPNGWNEWINLIIEKIKNYINLKNSNLIWYTSEIEYKTILESFNFKVELGNREKIKISATEIRNNPNKNINYIAKSFKKIFKESRNKND